MIYLVKNVQTVQLQTMFRMLRLFRQCLESVQNFQSAFRMFRICSDFSDSVQNFQSMFRIFSQCSECSDCSEFLAQKLVYSEFLDFVVIISDNNNKFNRPFHLHISCFHSKIKCFYRSYFSLRQTKVSPFMKITYIFSHNLFKILIFQQLIYFLIVAKLSSDFFLQCSN